MIYSVIMIERLNENGQFYRDVNFYQGSLSAFFLMNKHKKDDRFKEIIFSDRIIRREATLYGTVDLVDSMFPIKYPLILNDNKKVLKGPTCVVKILSEKKLHTIIKHKTSIKYNPQIKALLKGKRKTIYERDNYKCVICGEESIYLLTLDHIMPRSKGGSSSNNNLQTMCRKCNGEKADRVISNKELKIRMNL